MILRRVIEHVKAQNWTAVALDFVIVVVGVFIGIQVSNWNAARSAQLREDVYLQLLEEDVAAVKSAILAPAEIIVSRREAMLRVLHSLESCDETLASTDDFRRIFVEYPETITPSAVDATYREMVASGAFAAMQNGPLKQAIANLYAELEKLRFAGANVRISLPLVDEVVWRHVNLTASGSGAVELASYEFQDICGQRDLINAVVEMIDMQSDWKIFVTDLILHAVEEFEQTLSHGSADSGEGD